MEMEDFLVVNIGHPVRINFRSGGNDVDLFTIMVNIHSNRIIPIYYW